MQMIKEAAATTSNKTNQNKTTPTRRDILTSDTAMAQFMLSVAEEARGSGDVDMAEHFIEIAFDLLDQTA